MIKYQLRCSRCNNTSSATVLPGPNGEGPFLCCRHCRTRSIRSEVVEYGVKYSTKELRVVEIDSLVRTNE